MPKNNFKIYKITDYKIITHKKNNLQRDLGAVAAAHGTENQSWLPVSVSQSPQLPVSPALEHLTPSSVLHACIHALSLMDA